MARLRLGLGAILLVAVLLASGLGGGAHGKAVAADPHGRLPHPSRVAVLVLENRGFGQVIGNPAAPYVNRLARRYALATRYYSVGHPSVPNYLALTGGSTFGIRHDCNHCDAGARNLVDQLNAARVSWKAYFENLPTHGRLGLRTAVYNKHYNPFAYYTDLTANPRDRSRIVSFAPLQRDLAAHRLPRFAWIAPNLIHNGHYASLQTTDRYVAGLVPRVLHALGPDGVLYLTWDEGVTRAHTGLGGATGGGRVPLIAAGGAARRNARLVLPANHYALLRTIEGNFRLPALGQSGSSSTPLLSGLLRKPA